MLSHLTPSTPHLPPNPSKPSNLSQTHSVAKGIALAKRGEFSNALKCYQHALDIEPLYTHAYVARGAAYVLQGAYEQAVCELRTALVLDPNVSNAQKYLEAALQKIAARERLKERTKRINLEPNTIPTPSSASAVRRAVQPLNAAAALPSASPSSTSSQPYALPSLQPSAPSASATASATATATATAQATDAAHSGSGSGSVKRRREQDEVQPKAHKKKKKKEKDREKEKDRDREKDKAKVRSELVL